EPRSCNRHRMVLQERGCLMFPTAESGFLDPAATLAGRPSVAAKPLVQERPDPAEVPIPELAPQWKQLDLAEILKRPAAFLSISEERRVGLAGRTRRST